MGLLGKGKPSAILPAEGAQSPPFEVKTNAADALPVIQSDSHHNQIRKSPVALSRTEKKLSPLAA